MKFNKKKKALVFLYPEIGDSMLAINTLQISLTWMRDVCCRVSLLCCFMDSSLELRIVLIALQRMTRLSYEFASIQGIDQN